MKPLHIQQTEETPNILFDKGKEIFQVSGIALPENAIDFCTPAINWLNDYNNSPNEKTIFEFNLEYFNTAFSSQIIKFLLLLEKLSTKSDVTINWYYKDIDEDMKELGTKFSEIIKVKFNLIKYK